MKIIGVIFLLMALYYLLNFLMFGRVGAFFGFVILVIAQVILTILISERPKRFWFKSKFWGYGWTPVSWQGWVVTLMGALLLVGVFLCADRLSHSVSDTFLTTVPYSSLVLATLIAICIKTGEEAKWRWGK